MLSPLSCTIGAMSQCQPLPQQQQADNTMETNNDPILGDNNAGNTKVAPAERTDPAAASKGAASGPSLAQDQFPSTEAQADSANKSNTSDSNKCSSTENGSPIKANGNKRKRASGMKYKKRKVPSDLRLPPELEVRLETVKREQEAEEATCKALEEAERQLAEAQMKVDDAKQSKQAAAARVEAASEDLCRGLATTPGPWKDQYDRLVAYHTEHGTCIVRGQTSDLRSLRNWTLKQRERYHLEEDNANKLPWYHVKLLDKLGFLWKFSDDTWDKHYQDLVDYKKEFGHTAVPRGYKANQTLAHWVKRMRHEGNKFKEDPSSVSMTEEQLQKLKDLGFVWENLNRSWNERFEELVKFKEQHGHCTITKDSNVNPKLVQWCQNARAHHRAFMLGKKTSMTLERKNRLQELGFPWELSTKEHPTKRKKSVDDQTKEEGDYDQEIQRGPDETTKEEQERAQDYNRFGEGHAYPAPAYHENRYHRQPPYHFQGYYPQNS